jgi:arginase family enzyme
LHDLVHLERRGIPAVGIATAPFADEAIEQARRLGMPGARGLDVTIFNPNLDPDGSIARQLCELIARCVPAAG